MLDRPGRARRRRRRDAEGTVLGPSGSSDKYLRAADQRAGAYSVLVGVAANRCFTTGQPVKIADLVTNIGKPDYPKMPDHTGPVPMPKKG